MGYIIPKNAYLKNGILRNTMRTLIFDSSVTGHHLEYLHHYYMEAIGHTDEEYVIMVPNDFIKVKKEYDWPYSSNISFFYIPEEDEILLKETNFYKLGWNTSKILQRAVRKIKPDRVLLTMLMQFIPFIIFLLPRNVRVRGIMYKIYLYEVHRMGKLRLAAERLRFWLAARSSKIEQIFVLNDEDSARTFNTLYSTSKFRSLPDPVPSVDFSKVKSVREELGVSPVEKLYLHFGGLDGRKGTIDILKSIIASKKGELKDSCFVFAGRINKNTLNDFYDLLSVAKEKTRILVFDQFCSYDFLWNLCYSCDVILMPYHLTSLSSGILGYAAVFNKPVIGPDNGLIGNLIKKYELGISTQFPLKPEIYNNHIYNSEKGCSLYVITNSVKKFREEIFS